MLVDPSQGAVQALFMPSVVSTEKRLGRAALGRVPPLLLQFLRCLILTHFVVCENSFPCCTRGGLHDPGGSDRVRVGRNLFQQRVGTSAL